jgi:formiminotetrahydrofolate cyclodeaminase
MDDHFLTALAKPEPHPGGGAASAHGACVGLALLKKIVHLELRRSRGFSPSSWQNLLEEVKQSSTSLLRLRDEDGKAYIRFARAKTFGKFSNEALEALRQAIECPVDVMELASKGLNLVGEAGKHCKVHLLSDLQVASHLLQAAINGAYWIAQANLGLMQETSLWTDYQNRLGQILASSRETFASVQAKLVMRTVREANG